MQRLFIGKEFTETVVVPEELIYPDVTYWITLKRKVVVIWFVVEIMSKHVMCSY